jgi:hypothetical protein
MNTQPENVSELSQEKVNQEYAEKFVPGVHRIGRITTVVAFIAAFLPVFYLVFVRGFVAPAAVYMDVIIAATAYNIGAWIINPCAHFTVLGAASTYMSYLAGNVANMRIPVAMSVQNSLDTDINTPRGQVITIVGVATTVVINVLIIFVLVMFGNAILSILPEAVITSFKFIMAALFGSMLTMKFMSDPHHSLMYAVPAVAVFIVSRFVPFVKSYGTAFSILIPILCAYAIFRMTEGKGVADTDTPVDID